MRKLAFVGVSPKLLGGVMMAALLSACSSDVSRFDDPFANPFRGSSRFDNPNTGSVRQPSGRDMRRAAYEPVTTGSVSTSSLATPGQQSMPGASRPIIPTSRPSVQGLNPSAKASGFNPGVASANYPNLAPVAQRTGSALAPVSGASSGWTSVGGTPITLGQGDTVSSLSGKYGVPASAIMAVNGLGPSSRLAPGQQLMIPAYNAVQGTGGASAAIQRPATPNVARMAPKVVEDVEEEARKDVAPITSAPSRLKDMRAAAPEKVAQAAPRAASGTVRQVGSPNESDAEKRAAAKLRELKGAKPSVRDDDEDDDTPAPRKAEGPKAAPAAKAAPIVKSEDARLKAARADAERAKLEAEKAKAEAVKARAESDKAKAEMEKARTAKLAKAESGKLEAGKIEAEKAERARLASAEKAKWEKAKADKAKAEKLARAKKVEDDDSVTTGSIPTTKMPDRAPVEPKMAAKAEPKAEAAAETASADSFRWPAKGRVISGFGARGTGGANDGINIAVPEGTPVRAAEGGTVVHADDALKGYGKMVLVRHTNGYVSVYAHNGELNVKRGETVKRGQVIAHSGATGNVTSPQLHFELRKGAQPVDPTARLAD